MGKRKMAELAAACDAAGDAACRARLHTMVYKDGEGRVTRAEARAAGADIPSKKEMRAFADGFAAAMAVANAMAQGHIPAAEADGRDLFRCGLKAWLNVRLEGDGPDA